MRCCCQLGTSERWDARAASPSVHKPRGVRGHRRDLGPVPFSRASPISSNFWASRQSFPAFTPPRHLPPTASPGPTRALAHGHGHPDPALEWNLRTSSSCLASAKIPLLWQIIKPRQTLSCMLMVLSFTLFIWNCMGRLAIRIASGSSHSKPQGDFAHNKTLYQNQFSLILIFFPYLGRKTQLSSPQNHPAAMRLAANLSGTGLPPTAIAVSPCVGSGCEAWLCSAQPLSEPTASQRCHAGSSILGDTAAPSE